MSTQRKEPFRPRKEAEISQAYNDGVVRIYFEEDTAGSGYMPSPQPTLLITLCYQERKLGIRRYYDAKQNQIHIERVIRVPKPTQEITSQMIAKTEDESTYRIDLIQSVPDVYPPSLDLTLAVYTQRAWEFIPPLPPINQEGGDADAGTQPDPDAGGAGSNS